MKINHPVTDREHEFSSDIHIVSSTDLKGAITSCNEDFVKISGYSIDELMGKNHNIVRHPDMPEAAFADLWDNLKNGKGWMGIVKNRCKNGDYYWVDAYVTPIFEGSEVVGYQSVRVKPSASHVERAKSFYQQIKSGGSVLQRIKKVFSFNLQGKIFLGYLFSLLPIMAVLFINGGSKTAFMAMLIAIIAGLVMAKLIAKPWQHVASKSKGIFSNDVAQKIFCGRADELGQLQLVIYSQEERLRTIVSSIDTVASQLDEIANKTALVVDKSNSDIIQQRSEISMVATAMSQMSASVQEVAINTSDASAATKEAELLSKDGALVATNAITSIMSMVSDAEQGAGVVSQLAAQTDNIGSVLDVIRGIAEQTNLLALNAAIEAARAGEQGRGFAVVADEVRTLASRTHQSTQEIQDMIENLQVEAQKAVDAMLKAQTSAEQNMDAIESMAENMAEISGAVQTINKMNIQIASAAEEQQAVAMTVNGNIENISTASDHTAESSAQTAEGITHLKQESMRLRTMLRRFEIK